MPITYIIAAPSIIICAFGLIGLGLAVTRPEGPHLVRRHSGRQLFYRSVGSDLSDAADEMVVHHRHEPRHTTEDPDDPIWIMEQEIEGFVQVGRRGLDSPVRHLRVAEDWVPPLIDQNVRIAILETHTAEYLFARKPKDQLDVTRFVRSYVYSG